MRRDPGGREPGVGQGRRRPGFGQLAQPGEPGRVAHSPPSPRARCRWARVTIQASARADHVPADQHQQPGRQVVRRHRRPQGRCRCSQSLAAAGTHELPGWSSAPRCFPTLLPGVPGECGQPAQQLGHPAPPRRPGWRSPPGGTAARSAAAASRPRPGPYPATIPRPAWAGNRLRSWLLRGCAGTAAPVRPPACLRAMCFTIAVMTASRTAPPATAGHSPAPAAAAGARAPGTGGRGGRARPR